MPENLPYRSYIPSTEAEIAEMRLIVGVTSLDDLYADVPQDKLNPKLNLPKPMNEQELRRYMGGLASRNVVNIPSFLGYGAYRHFIPSIIGRIIGRDEYETAYTPYQPEISQPTLQTIYDFQSQMCFLMGMEVANSGMLDEATALAEAALMASRVTGRREITVMDTVHPNSLEVVRNYAKGKPLTVDLANADREIALSGDTAALLVQCPNYLGYIEDLRRLTDVAHKNGSLMIVSVDNITSLGVLEGPGNFGADIVVGNGQGFGLPVDLGGANVGIFTSKQRYVREMPGRIVGRTTDKKGRTAYVLTLQPREQHISRERATSNICTAEALMALAANIYLANHGPEGFEDLARLNVVRAHRAAEKINKIPGYRVINDRPFLNEFVVQCPKPPDEINRALLHPERAEDRIIGGVDVSNKIQNGMLICVTEMNSEGEVEQLVAALAKAA